MTTTKVCIVGGGFAGTKLALELANNDQFTVTLITPRTRFEYHGAMYRSATGKSPLEAVVPYSEIFSDMPNISVELDSVAELRPQTAEIVGETGRIYKYDYLVMSVGYVVNYFGIHGMAEYSENMYDVTAAIQLRHRLVGAFRTAKAEKNVQISIIGGGPTGVEIASDIQTFADMVADKHQIPRITIDVTLIEAAPRVLCTLSELSSAAALQRLEILGVKVLTNTKVERCTKRTVHTNDQTIESDITIWTAGNKANPLFGAYPDLFSLNERGRVQVDELLRANSPNIFVIGDAADTPYSGMAQTAIHNGIFLGDTLKKLVLNQETSTYVPKKPEYVVPIGGDWALLETENGIRIGSDGWAARREADKWVLENFLVYEKAKKHWDKENSLANF